MINAKYLSVNEVVAFCTIVSEKNNPGRGILEVITNRVLASYNDYLTAFDHLVHQRGSAFATENQEKALLNNCYTSTYGTFPSLRSLIFSKQETVLKSYCPYCFIGWPGTIDHYVGQTEFPEFSILFKNMIPCCDNCNRVKDDYWRKNGVRRILHFYNDTFIRHRFLYGRIVQHRDASTPNFYFYLKRPAEISITKFQTIKSHFERFDLLTKYNERANALISSKIADLEQNRAAGQTKTFMIDELNRTYHNLSLDFGVNYWQGIISETIASTRRIINSL